MSSIRSLLSLLRGRVSGHDATAAAAKAAQADTDFRLLTENSTDVICRMGPRMLPVYVSPSVEHVLGWSVKEMMEGVGTIHPDDFARVADIHAGLTSGEHDVMNVIFRFLHKNGTSIWMETNARLVRDPADGTPGDVVIVMRDISDRKRLEDELRALALTDGLTGLANRRAFDEVLMREWQRTTRDGSQMSLLLLDIDHFKRFNDLYGHQAGDDCLRVVARAIEQAVSRPADRVARYGGEEIAVILPETVAAGALVVAENVRSAIETLAIDHAGNVNAARTVTASIGVATAFSRPGGTMKMPEGLLLAADSALYKAKQDGRNRVSTTILLAAQEGASRAA